MDHSLGGGGGGRVISNSSEKGRGRGHTEVPAVLGSTAEGTDPGMVTVEGSFSGALKVE